MSSKYMNRKDIAREYEVTVDQVRKNEAAWGLLQPVKQRLTRSSVRYLRSGVEKAFKERGWL